LDFKFRVKSLHFNQKSLTKMLYYCVRKIPIRACLQFLLPAQTIEV